MNSNPSNDYSVLVRDNRFIDIEFYNRENARIIQNLDCIIDYDITDISIKVIKDSKYLGVVTYGSIDNLCNSIDLKGHSVIITLRVNGGLAEANYLAAIIINRLEKVITLNRIYKSACAERGKC